MATSATGALFQSSRRSAGRIITTADFPVIQIMSDDKRHREARQADKPGNNARSVSLKNESVLLQSTYANMDGLFRTVIPNHC